MAFTATQEVIERTENKNNRGLWLQLKLKTDKGIKTPKVFDKNVVAQIQTVGTYEMTMEKNEKGFWDIVNAKLVADKSESAPKTDSQGQGAAPRASAPSNGGGYQVTKMGLFTADVVLQNRAITAQVAMKVAGELAGKLAERGAFSTQEEVKVVEVGAKGKETTTDGKGYTRTTIDADAAADFAATLCRVLLKEAGDFVRSQPEKTEKPGSYKDEAGRTHEPVAEGA